MTGRYTYCVSLVITGVFLKVCGVGRALLCLAAAQKEAATNAPTSLSLLLFYSGHSCRKWSGFQYHGEWEKESPLPQSLPSSHETPQVGQSLNLKVFPIQAGQRRQRPVTSHAAPWWDDHSWGTGSETWVLGAGRCSVRESWGSTTAVRGFIDQW